MIRITIFVLFILVGVYFLWMRGGTSPFFWSTPSPTPIALSTGTQVSTDRGDYTVYLQKITDPDRLTLIPNFTEKKSSPTIAEEHECVYGTSGGFYTADEKPLGFFYGGDVDQRRVHNEALFNGFVYKLKNGNIGITRESSMFNNSVEFMFQSGPVFTPKSILQIRQDEPARRILLARDQSTYFLMGIVGVDNTNTGPYLEELPEILANLEVPIDEAINLDGGAASTFKSGTGIHLGEVLPIGSFLCGKA